MSRVSYLSVKKRVKGKSYKVMVPTRMMMEERMSLTEPRLENEIVYMLWPNH